MKKLILALSFCCSLALAENTASAPINKSTQNSSNDQPKLIMVKGVTSNQTNSVPQKQASKAKNSHAKKNGSHKPTKARKSTKNTKHTKTTAKKTAHTSHTKKPTQAPKYSSK